MRPACYVIFFFTVSCLVSSSSFAATSTQINAARINGLAWLMSEQTGDGDWKNIPQLDVQATAAAIEAFTNAGINKGFSFSAAVTALSNTKAKSVDSLSRQIVALNTVGSDISMRMATLLNARNDFYYSWGAYAKYQASFPDSTLALDSILLTNTSYADTGSTLGFIASRQNPDGGWPYNANAPITSQSRVMPTAHNVLSFARHRAVGWGVDAYITSGVNWLVAQAKADGGFADDASAGNGSDYETAMVYLALAKAQAIGNAAAVGAQAAVDAAQDFLINSQLANGSWSDDPFQTAVVLQTLPAVVLPDTDQDGLPDDVEVALGSDPLVADTRTLATGNGEAVDGVTTSSLLASIVTGDSFSLFLSPPAGSSGPYIWEILSGSLPDGLSLNAATGEISGIATSAGTFNFTYGVTDGSNASSSVAAQIAATAADAAEVVPVLPLWGSIAMAIILFLLGFTSYRQRQATQ